MIEQFLVNLKSISLSQWVAIIASTGTALTAFFSWRAIQQAEAITLKPIIALKGASYFEDTLSISVYNLSKDGDRWARDIAIKIENSNIKVNNKGYVGPGENCTLRIDNIKKNEWQGKIMEISYRTFNGKIYKMKYKFANNVVKESAIHSDATFVDLDRIN